MSKPRSLSDAPLWGYGVALITSVVAVLVVQALVSPDQPPLYILLIVPIFLGAYAGGFGPGGLATLLVVVGSVYLAVEPKYSLRISSVTEVVRLSLLAAVGLVISLASESVRRASRRVQRRAEQALLESQSRYERIAATFPGILYDYAVHSDGSDEFLYLSPRFKEVVELDAQAIMKDIRLFWGLIHRDDFAGLLAARDRSYHHALDFNYEVRIVTPSGRLKWIAFNSSPNPVPAGQKPMLWTGAMIDVTERKEREEALAEARRVAEIANKAKDNFLSVLSHELRTPLTAILGWTKILKSGKVDDAAKQMGLEVIERNTYAQTRLIEDLLDVSRAISGKIVLACKPLLIGEVVRAVSESLRPSALSKGLKLEVDLDGADLVVQADAQRFTQIISNLISNSIKFTPVGGTVRVRLGRENNAVVLVVSDTGIGIDREILPYVFDRFRQADSSITRRFQGLGLGLAIVRHLVEMHGGSVEAHSAGKEKGATFTVRMPAAEGLLDSIRHRSTEQRADAGVHRLSNLRILLVEDDVDTRDVLVVVLAAHGANVRPVGTAKEALTAFEEFKPQLLLSDIGLPGEDGYTLVRRIQGTAGSMVPALALTAFARPEDRSQALAAGFQAHIAKPVEPERLLEEVEALAFGRKRAAA